METAAIMDIFKGKSKLEIIRLILKWLFVNWWLTPAITVVMVIGWLIVGELEASIKEWKDLMRILWLSEKPA